MDIRKITKEDREIALNKINELESMINSGKWDYSINTLRQEHHSYSVITWPKAHPILFILLLLFCLPLGFIPAIIYFLILMIQNKYAESYELHLTKLKNNTLGRENAIKNNANSLSTADEILKLHKLKEEGVLTEEEFNKKKKDLLAS